jgi:hypothetical protein
MLKFGVLDKINVFVKNFQNLSKFVVCDVLREREPLSSGLRKLKKMLYVWVVVVLI